LWVLLAEIRLKVNEGTQRTSVSVRLSKITTIPMCVTGTVEPLGNLTKVKTTAVMVVKRDGQLIMWSVATVSII
jgi:hypothetical protein